MSKISIKILEGNISVWETVNSLAVFGLYCAILLNRILISNLSTIIWYGVAVVCVILALVVDKGNIASAILALFLVCWITGGLNSLFIGNYSLRKLLFALMSIAIARLLIDKSVNTIVIKWALYINVLYVLYKFATRGLFMEVYANASNNYISIQIIQCVVIYYTLVEAKGEAFDFKPAVIALVIAVASQGRGGIVALGVMVIGLLICRKSGVDTKAHNRQYSFKEIFTGIVIAVIAFAAIWFLISYIKNVNPDESVFRKFHNLGMSGNGRSAIWSEYFNIVSMKTKYYICGGRLDLSPFLKSYNLNLHNSFLEIHAYNGIIMLIAVLILLCNTVAYGIRNKRPVMIVCLITICLRGLLDQMLWATTGMPFFVFYLIYPMIMEQKQGYCS